MRPALLLVVLMLVGAGCASGDEPLPSELTGLIVAIEGEGSEISAFTLESGLEVYEIRIADDVDYRFDLIHLREHEQKALPVRCELEERDGELYARRIEDAD